MRRSRSNTRTRTLAVMAVCLVVAACDGTDQPEDARSTAPTSAAVDPNKQDDTPAGDDTGIDEDSPVASTRISTNVDTSDATITIGLEIVNPRAEPADLGTPQAPRDATAVEVIASGYLTGVTDTDAALSSLSRRDLPPHRPTVTLSGVDEVVVFARLRVDCASVVRAEDDVSFSFDRSGSTQASVGFGDLEITEQGERTWLARLHEEACASPLDD